MCAVCHLFILIGAIVMLCSANVVLAGHLLDYFQDNDPNLYKIII